MKKIESEDNAAAQALASVFARSVTELTTVANEQMQAIGATAALVACLPDTAHIPPERIAAVIDLLARERQDGEAHRQKLARFAGLIMSTARLLHEQEPVGAEPSGQAGELIPAAPNEPGPIQVV